MEVKLIDGHNQFIFSQEEKEMIRDMYLNQNYTMRAICRYFNCSQKPIKRVFDEIGIDHSRGNTGRYKYYFENDIYDPEYERDIKEQIKNIKSKKQKYGINEFYFDDLDNPEVIYTIGFLYADGCNQYERQITIALEEQDGYILKQINQNMNNENPVKFVDKSNKHDFGYTYKNQYQLDIYNSRIAKVLSLLGVVPRKSLILTFPRWLNPKMYSHFIRGVFDGDGSIYRYVRENKKGHTLTITSTEDFCKALSDITVKYVNVNPAIYDASCHNGITKVFNLSGKDVTKKFMDWMYQDATIFLKRKYDRYIDYFYTDNSLSA